MASIQIGSKSWVVSVARTASEITRGLSGAPSLPLGTGMLFDLGYDYKPIRINMSEMLFPLDIIFINSSSGVVEVLANVQPGQDAQTQNEAGARYFLEINAGEAEGVSVGDSVTISGQDGIGGLLLNLEPIFINIASLVLSFTALMYTVGRDVLRWAREPGLPDFVEITDVGDTTFKVGDVVPWIVFSDENELVRGRGNRPATAKEHKLEEKPPRTNPIKQIPPRTVSQMLEEKLGATWGIHSPLVLSSIFDPRLKKYVDLALLHREMTLGGMSHPEVFFDEKENVVKFVPATQWIRGRAVEAEYFWGKPLKEYYREFKFTSG